MDEPDQALDVYTVLRESLKRGLRRVMDIPREHPHYVAAVVVAVGCEAVGRLMSATDGETRAPSQIFADELVAPYLTESASSQARAVGRDLFDAIRNGIAHRFDTKPVELIDGRQIQVMVNWGERYPHLSLSSTPPVVYINLFQLQRDFEAMLDRYRETLRQTSRSGRTLSPDWYHDRKAVTYAGDESSPGWVGLLDRSGPGVQRPP